MPRALILGVTGQDGQFLADLLLEKKYEVVGIARAPRAFLMNPLSLRRPIFKSMDILETNELSKIIQDFDPDEIYNLAGESSVSNSFENPSSTIKSNVVGVVNLLNCVRKFSKTKKIRLFQASSAEMFGSSNEQLNELSNFNPKSPYAFSKLAAHQICQLFRKDYAQWISCGILFNHESELRPENYVFKKVISSAVAISKGKLKKIKLGNIDIRRDWGYSRDYVEAMWLILQAETPDDFVIATGEQHSLKDLLHLTLNQLGISSAIDEFVELDVTLKRPADIESTWGDPDKIKKGLGWSANIDFENLISKIIRYEKALSFK